jgi:TonB family protein
LKRRIAAIESSIIMSNLLKWAIFVALFCAPGTGQTGSSASQQAPPASGVAATNEQAASKPKPDEYRLDPVETSKAIYPPEAKEKGIQGQVVGMILVSETGSVESAHFFKGDPILAASAAEAAKTWRFKPVLKDGKPMAVVSRATFNFVLSNDIHETKDVVADLDQITSLPRRVRVSSGVSQGLMLRKVSPVYPEEARRARIQGVVLLHAIISKDGDVEDLQVISGPDALVPAAMEAVRQWRYKPYLWLGRPLEVDTQIQVNFTLSSR